jgi:probable DNA metabolism protein
MDKITASGTDDLFANEPFPPSATALSVALQGPVDLAGFRQAARRLLAQQITPDQVRWHCSAAVLPEAPMASKAQDAAAADVPSAPSVNVPPEFLSLCQSVIQHRDPGRFDLLYRLLWRLMLEPALRHDLLDADMARAQRMAQAVRNDQHSLKTLLRFRSVQDDSFKTHPEGGPLHLAWFEPEHHVVEALAPFFAQRFAQMRWAILTPERSLAWDYARPQAKHFAASRAQADEPVVGALGALRFGPGVCSQDAPPADASTQRWLGLYQQTFPATRRRRQALPKEKRPRDWNRLAQSPQSVACSPSADSAGGSPLAGCT